ncbi:hypothetical protein H5410_033455 [Solanum commersonii]|uniref:Uncharacterized protein n=1 Tax=Solanum commersonii TaxID=4109 RepID=A0A9J5YQ77_SOLCO|nr:hypothetical protein H5410_033455 [Solanum commersonii]
MENLRESLNAVKQKIGKESVEVEDMLCKHKEDMFLNIIFKC